MMTAPSLESISAQLALISAKQDTAATAAAANAAAFTTKALESLSADTQELVLNSLEVTKQNRIMVLGPLLQEFAGTWIDGVRSPRPVQAGSFYDMIKPLVDTTSRPVGRHDEQTRRLSRRWPRPTTELAVVG